ncbi:MAG: hypothetical protein ABI569_09115 [Casimicrobiaceae bacterium]
MPEYRRPFPQPIAFSAVGVAVLFSVAALGGCSRAPPELTAAAMQAFVETRAAALQARNVTALCSQYADGAEVRGALGDEPVILTKMRYCNHIAEEFDSHTGEAAYETSLSLKSVVIAPSGKTADLELEQLDLAGAPHDATRYERRTQISAHVESVAGKPLITRESRKETIGEARPPAR